MKYKTHIKYTVSKRQIQNTSASDSLYRFMLSLFSEDLHPLPEHKPQLKYPEMIQTLKQSVPLQVVKESRTSLLFCALVAQRRRSAKTVSSLQEINKNKHIMLLDMILKTAIRISYG